MISQSDAMCSFMHPREPCNYAYIILLFEYFLSLHNFFLLVFTVSFWDKHRNLSSRAFPPPPYGAFCCIWNQQPFCRAKRTRNQPQGRALSNLWRLPFFLKKVTLSKSNLAKVGSIQTAEKDASDWSQCANALSTDCLPKEGTTGLFSLAF